MRKPFPTAKNDSETEVYRCAPLTRARFGASLELIRSHWSQKQSVVPGADLEHILSCSRFETLADHCTRLGAGNAKSGQDLLRALSELAHRGVLVSSRDLQSRQKEDREDRPVQPHIACLAIPTCARPDKLRRSLPSYVKNAKHFGRNYSFLISDDSPLGADRRANKSAAREIQKRFGLTTLYVSRTERASYARLLSSEGDIPPNIAQFALLGPNGARNTYGANRNAILLHTHGSLFLSADDDTIGDPGVVPGSAPGLRIQPHSDASQLWSFPDRQRAMGFASPAELDIASEHERLLGVPVLHAVREGGGTFPASLNDACNHMWASVCSGSGRIVVTTAGIAGDSAMLNTRDALRMSDDPGTRQELASNKAYRAALRSREIVRQVQASTISHSGPLMATCIGLDNRLLLPPFFPMYRNEDGIFGQMLMQSFPHGYSGQLPFVLKHEPDGKRSDPSEHTGTPFRFSEFLLECLSTWHGAPVEFSQAARLRSIGRHLTDLAEMPDAGLLEFLRTPLWNRAAATIGRCESLLACFSPPQGDPWERDLRLRISRLQKEMIDPARRLPSDLHADYPTDTWKHARRLMGQYGELLCWWPAIVEKDGMLAAKDRTLAVPIGKFE